MSNRPLVVTLKQLVEKKSVENIILESPLKSCKFHRLPTSVLKLYINELLPAITKYASFNYHGTVPSATLLLTRHASFGGRGHIFFSLYTEFLIIGQGLHFPGKMSPMKQSREANARLLGWSMAFWQKINA